MILKKRVDGILANIWIGQKKLNGKDVTIEWYFLAESWNKTEWAGKSETTPLKIVVFSPIPIPQTNLTVKIK